MPEQEAFAQSHRLLGTLLELALTPLEILVRVEAQLLSEAPQADVLLLRRAGAAWTEAQRARLPDGVRDSAAGHVLIEFKYTESVNERALTQAVSYDHFYRQGQRLNETQVLTVVLSARTPQAKHLAQWGYKAEQPGVYRSELPLLRRVMLLVLNQLPTTPHNAFVKLFASRGSERDAAFDAMKEATAAASVQLRAYVVGLQEAVESSGGITMAEVLTPEKVMEIGKKRMQIIIEMAPPEQRLAGLAPEQRLAGLAPEQVIAGMSEEERRKLLQLLLADTDLDPAEN